MRKRLAIGLGLGAAALSAAAGAAWILSLPAASDAATAPQISPQETAAALHALQPPKRKRPLIAVIGVNEGTETTDYLMPLGILRRADVAEVVALATKPGLVTLYPALRAAPDATIAQFDAQHPQGADYVIVPALRHEDDPAVLGWIRGQAAKGATVIGVCVGAKVVANAGLLDGKRATSHWYYLGDLQAEHPRARYVADRRLVVDGAVATTTGITASMPMTLTLIEAIAGREKAAEVARDLGLAHWDARHSSAAFGFTRPFALTAIGNRAAVWGHEQLGLQLVPGVDEVALALVADAWSRTYRSRAVSFAAKPGATVTRSGLLIFPDRVQEDWPAARRIPAVAGPAAGALDAALQDIDGRYGRRTKDFVAMQLEYPPALGASATAAVRPPRPGVEEQTPEHSRSS